MADVEADYGIRSGARLRRSEAMMRKKNMAVAVAASLVLGSGPLLSLNTEKKEVQDLTGVEQVHYCPSPGGCWHQMPNRYPEWSVQNWYVQTRYSTYYGQIQGRFQVAICNMTVFSLGWPTITGQMRMAGRWMNDGDDLGRSALATTPNRVAPGSCAATPFTAWQNLGLEQDRTVQVSNAGVAIRTSVYHP